MDDSPLPPGAAPPPTATCDELPAGRWPADEAGRIAHSADFALRHFPADVEHLRPSIVEAVDFAVRSVFPEKYCSLCHAYAIVGSNVASIVLAREYRPVAGLAVIDCGSGDFLDFTETDAFARDIGGAYHCWIESCADDPAHARELVDIAFLHNGAYARAHGLSWRHEEARYLWGAFDDLVIDAELADLPRTFPPGRVWFRETPEGAEWLVRHLRGHMQEYVTLTGLALKILGSELRLPAVDDANRDRVGSASPD